MLQAERDAKERKVILKNDLESGNTFAAIIPVLTLIIITFSGLMISGYSNSNQSKLSFHTIISNADSVMQRMYVSEPPSSGTVVHAST